MNTKNDLKPRQTTNSAHTSMNHHHTKNLAQLACCRTTSLNRFTRTVFAAASLAVSLGLLLPINTQASPPRADVFDEDARWFQVELILFSQQTNAALDAEQWPNIEGLHLPDALLELHLPPPAPQYANPDEIDEMHQASNASIDAAPTDTLSAPFEEPESDLPTAYRILAEGERQLTKMAQKIQRSPKRDLLLHIAWQQPTYDRKQAQPIYFVAGMAEPLPLENTTGDETSLPLDGDTAESASSFEEPTTFPAEEMLPPVAEYATEEDAKIGPRDPQFTGTVTLSVERYLHLAANLVYRRPVTQHTAIPVPDLELWYDRPYPTLQEPQGPAFQQMSWQATRGFRLKESRRMRSTEIHYLDHPFMGMVVVITPVELPEPAEEIQQTSPQNILSTPSRMQTKP